MCSLIVSQYAKNLISTDYKDQVLKLIKENLDSFGSPKCTRKVAKLDWGNSNFSELTEFETGEKITDEILKGVDYVIGSDIVYWESSVAPLFNALNVLLD